MRLIGAFLVLFLLGGCLEAPAPPPARAVKAAGPRLPARIAVQNFEAVVRTVEPVAENTCRQRGASKCNFRIIVDDRPGQPPNAFQTVDRRGRPVIAFTLSLIADARNRDELAFIMGHEAAHHILGHIAKTRESATAGALVGGLVGVLAGVDPQALDTFQNLGATVGARAYSKAHELQADRLGTIIAYRAGYDPALGAKYFQRISDPGNEFLGTHPANSDRIRMVRKTLAKLKGGGGGT